MTYVGPVERILQYFTYNHLPEGKLREVSKSCCALARAMAEELPVNNETTTGLRKLLEAKDCFVRSALDREV